MVENLTVEIATILESAIAEYCSGQFCQGFWHQCLLNKYPEYFSNCYMIMVNQAANDQLHIEH